MLNLVISATEKLVVELFENGSKVSCDINVDSSKAEDILKIVDAKLAGGDISQVDNILLNVGPGSFTGIRASMALVFGLTRNGKPSIVPFTTFDGFALNKVSSNTALVVAGFSNFVYAKYKLGRKAYLECVEYQSVANLAKSHGLELVVSNDAVQSRFEKLGVQAKTLVFDAEHINRMFESGKLEKRSVEPLYLRASQAELAKEERERNGKLKH